MLQRGEILVQYLAMPLVSVIKFPFVDVACQRMQRCRYKALVASFRHLLFPFPPFCSVIHLLNIQLRHVLVKWMLKLLNTSFFTA